MKKELQIFLIWDKGRNWEKQILNDISAKYEILQTFEISWPKKSFPSNITRFYSKNMRGGYRKTKECGTGDFIFITCMDPKPEYVKDVRHACGSNSNAIINKSTYRQWTGGTFLVHASDNFGEVEENLLFMLGMTIEEFLKNYADNKWDGKHLRIEKDMPGSQTWESLQDLFNFADKIKEISNITHKNDILEITTQNIKKTTRYLNLKKKFFGFSKNSYLTKVGDRKLKVKFFEDTK